MNEKSVNPFDIMDTIDPVTPQEYQDMNPFDRWMFHTQLMLREYYYTNQAMAQGTKLDPSKTVLHVLNILDPPSQG